MSRCLKSNHCRGDEFSAGLNQCEAEAKAKAGDLIYIRNSPKHHRPRVRIAESSSPANAAAVAAPTLKLCPT